MSTFDSVKWQAELKEHLAELPNQDVARQMQADASRRMLEHIKADQQEEAGWKIYTLADAYEPRSPLQYVVEGLFSLPSLSVVYGAPGTLKSMVLVDMCACVAAGLPWLPPREGTGDATAIKTLKSPILWCDFDNGKRRTDERIDAIGKAYGVPKETPLHYVSMPSPWLDMSSKEAADEMIDRVLTLGAKLVVIDNLGVVSGSADENSAQMSQVMAHCRRLPEETGSAVILIHHQRKSNGNNARAGETLRGHSSIEAALDLVLLVEREERSNEVKMKSTKVRGNDVPPFGATFAFKHKPDTDELAEARFYGVAVEDVLSSAAIHRAILSALDGKEVNKGNLTKAVQGRLSKVGVNRIRDHIDYLADDGKIDMTNGPGTAKLYSLPSDPD